jgi:peroxiredoxin
MTMLASSPAWMRHTLRAAALYNLLWGAWAILFPAHFWSLLGMAAPNYPFLWQCIGMIVGVYGIGYWVAGNDPARHWPIVLVGLLGKVLGPIGFLQAWLIDQAVPARFGLTIITNDLIWWVPFALILAHAYRVAEASRNLIEESPAQLDLSEALTTSRAADGRSLADISHAAPALVIFLRHAGCTFCRETLADLQRQRGAVDRAGVVPVLVHMGSDEQARTFFARYGLGDVPRISDPGRRLYRAFDLRRGRLSEVFGPRVWIRGFVAGILHRHGVGAMVGDGFQMPGAFIVHKGRIVRAFRHRDASDRPDYARLTDGAACAV